MWLTCPILNLIVLRPSDFALKMRTLLWLPKLEPAIAWDTNFQCRPQGYVLWDFNMATCLGERGQVSLSNNRIYSTFISI